MGLLSVWMSEADSCLFLDSSVGLLCPTSVWQVYLTILYFVTLLYPRNLFLWETKGSGSGWKGRCGGAGLVWWGVWDVIRIYNIWAKNLFPIKGREEAEGKTEVSAHHGMSIHTPLGSTDLGPLTVHFYWSRLVSVIHITYNLLNSQRGKKLWNLFYPFTQNYMILALEHL